MVTDDELRARLTEAGFEALIPRILEGAADEIWITPTRRDDLAPTASRIGGRPHLPAGTPWPRHRWPRAEVEAWPDYARVGVDQALADGVVVVEPDPHGNLDGAQLALALPFVAQLDLAAIAPLSSRLPPRGHLWLFADQMTPVGELDHQYHCACACVYADEPGDVPAVPPPLPESFPAYALAFAAGRTYPDAAAFDVRGDAWARLHAVLSPLAQGEPRHAMFSRPTMGTGVVPPDGHLTLLRVDSDYRGDDTLNWGDASTMTFAIHPDDLAARRWSEVRAFRFDG